MKDSPLNWNLIAEEIKDEIVDFSVNINPLGIPDLVKDHLMHINGIGNRYPDSECKQLRDLLAQKYKIHPENILCGNGADDLLYRLIFAVKPKQAFSVSIPAQLAGICALMDSEYMEKTYRLIESEREWIINELKKYGVKTYSSKTNFLLIQTNEENVVQKLLDKGIKVRDCSKFYGLDSSYCRVAIWNHSENLVLLQAFKELFVK